MEFEVQKEQREMTTEGKAAEAGKEVWKAKMHLSGLEIRKARGEEQGKPIAL